MIVLTILAEGVAAGPAQLFASPRGNDQWSGKLADFGASDGECMA